MDEGERAGLGDGAGEISRIQTTTRDPRDIARRFQRWVSETVGVPTRVLDVRSPVSAGFSSDTYLIDCQVASETTSYVLRLPPPADAFPLFPSYDLARQVRAMRLVRKRTKAPVPAVPWFDEDPRHLGSPFFVMERASGDPVSDNPPYTFSGWLHDAAPELRRAVADACVALLVEIHSIQDPEDIAVIVPPAASDRSLLRRHVDDSRAHYEWAARSSGRVELIERGFEWLERNWPTESAETLTWGDARPANILWNGSEPTAVLDWEAASAGPPELDVGWMLFFHRFFQDVAERAGFVGLPDFMDRAQFIERYESASGRTLADLDWFETYAAVKQAIVAVRIIGRQAHFGEAAPPDDPDDMIFHRRLLEAALVDAASTWQ